MAVGSSNSKGVRLKTAKCWMWGESDENLERAGMKLERTARKWIEAKLVSSRSFRCEIYIWRESERWVLTVLCIFSSSSLILRSLSRTSALIHASTHARTHICSACMFSLSLTHTYRWMITAWYDFQSSSNSSSICASMINYCSLICSHSHTHISHSHTHISHSHTHISHAHTRTFPLPFPPRILGDG